MDLQFQILGLIATYGYARSRQNGLVFSLSMVALGWAYYYNQVAIHKPSPVLMEHPVKMDRIFGFLKYHFLIYPNLNYYFGGLILATTVGTPLPSTTLVKYGLLGAFAVTFICGQYFIALHNIFHLISAQYVPLFMVAHKLVWTVSFFSAGLYLTNFWNSSRAQVGEEKVKATGNSVEQCAQTSQPARYSFLSGLTRVVFAIYLVNYFVIRTHFFTSRILLPRTVFEMVAQISHVRAYTIIVAFVFHLLFIMPFENIRKRYF